MPDKPRLAPIVVHPSSAVQLEPVTPEGIAQSKAAQQAERADAIAHLLCGYDDMAWAHLSKESKAHYRRWALIAMRGATLSVRQYGVWAYGQRAVAESLMEIVTRRMGDMPFKIERSKEERKSFMGDASRVIHVLLGHLSGEDEERNLGLYGTALGVTE